MAYNEEKKKKGSKEVNGETNRLTALPKRQGKPVGTGNTTGEGSDATLQTCTLADPPEPQGM